jgi:hypothetical protein
MGGFRGDIETTRRRLAARERRVLRDPRFGDIEVARSKELTNERGLPA